METPNYPVIILADNPNRRAEFWSADECVVVYQYTAHTDAEHGIRILTITWLDRAPGNCVNICSV